MVQIGLKRDRKWAFKLQAFNPYGLNEKGSGGNGNSNIDKVVVGKFFLSLP